MGDLNSYENVYKDLFDENMRVGWIAARDFSTIESDSNEIFQKIGNLYSNETKKSAIDPDEAISSLIENDFSAIKFDHFNKSMKFLTKDDTLIQLLKKIEAKYTSS